MTEPNPILQELTELQSSLANTSQGLAYQAPTGYFDGLADEMLNRVKALDAVTVADELAYLSPLLSQAVRVNPYTVPANYFEELEETLPYALDQSTDAETELAELSPLLSGLKKQIPYTVPQGYFDSLEPAVTETKAPAKVISMNSRKWMRYAAAIIIAVIGIGGYFMINRSQKTVSDTNSLAWVEKSLNKVSTEDIDKFVELTGDENTSIAKTDTPEEIKNLLKDVSDKDIQDFLNDAPTSESDTDDLLLN